MSERVAAKEPRESIAPKAKVAAMQKNADIYMKDSVDGIGCCCGASCIPQRKAETPRNGKTTPRRIEKRKEDHTRRPTLSECKTRGTTARAEDSELVRFKRGGGIIRRTSDHAQPKQGGFRSTPRSMPPQGGQKNMAGNEIQGGIENFTQKIFELN